MDRETTRGIVSGMEIGKAVAQALGLPAETNLIQIRIGLDEAVEVIARYYPCEDAMQQVAGILSKYQLICREEAPDDTWVGEPVMDPISHTEEE